MKKTMLLITCAFILSANNSQGMESGTVGTGKGPEQAASATTTPAEPDQPKPQKGLMEIVNARMDSEEDWSDATVIEDNEIGTDTNN